MILRPLVLLCPRTTSRLCVLPRSRLVCIPSNIVSISTLHVFCTGQIQRFLRLDVLLYSRRVHIIRKMMSISLFISYECVLMILRVLVLLCSRRVRVPWRDAG